MYWHDGALWRENPFLCTETLVCLSTVLGIAYCKSNISEQHVTFSYNLVYIALLITFKYILII